MEAGNHKQKGTSEQSHPSFSSPGIYGSIFFTPSPKIFGRESVRYDVGGSKTKEETLISKIDNQDSDSIFKNLGIDDKNKGMSWTYEEHKVQPCHLSSSIYYGGQDVYPPPQSSQNVAFSSSHKNARGEDETQMATRGDWWQGSLYY